MPICCGFTDPTQYWSSRTSSAVFHFSLKFVISLTQNVLLYSQTFAQLKRDCHWLILGHMALTKIKSWYITVRHQSMMERVLKLNWIQFFFVCEHKNTNTKPQTKKQRFLNGYPRRETAASHSCKCCVTQKLRNSTKTKSPFEAKICLKISFQLL